MNPILSRTLKDLSLSAVVAGFIAVLVGLTSSIAIVFQASRTVGATPEQTASWVCSIGIAMAATSIGLSWHYRQPVLTAWSTPGAALLPSRSSSIATRPPSPFS